MSDEKKPLASEPIEESSPACLAARADDVYMGFAAKAELAAFLDAVARAADGPDATAARIRLMLPRIRDDAVYATLRARLRVLEGCP